MAETKKTAKKGKASTAGTAVGIGAGVAGGAAAGAAVGSLAGPIGTGVGAVVGAAVGGVAGKKVADVVDPVKEEKYWKAEYRHRPYYTREVTFPEVWPAYRLGVETVNKHPGTRFEEHEARLSRSWRKARGESSLTWGRAKDAVRDAFDRTLQLHEERLHVDKQPVQTGEVKVRKEVRTERKQIDVPVEREEVVIRRRPAKGKAGAGSIGGEEEVRIPVKEERVRVTKEVVPTEEVSVGRRKVREVKHVDEPVRREEAVVKEEGDVRVNGGARKRG